MNTLHLVRIEAAPHATRPEHRAACTCSWHSTYTTTRAVAVVDGATHAASPSSLPEGDDRG